MKKSFKINFQEMSVEETLYFFGIVMLPPMLMLGYFVTELIVPNLPMAECFIWKFFGAYCPGCGGTRALIAMLHGHFILSTWYHPLLMYCLIMYLLFMGSHTLVKLHVPHIKGMPFNEKMMYGMLVVLVLNCVLKNVLKFGFGIVMQ